MEKPRYTIKKKLKEGGFGTIYRGFDNELDIPIVIKKIHVEGMDAERQFKIAYDDALIASQLRGHPNIVNVYGFKKTETNKYIIIMEYINGYNLIELNERLKQLNLQLPLDFSLYIISQVCEGLQYAHTRVDENVKQLNIIHRDISPSNIMVSFNGFVKIIDFGIAKGRVREQSETGEGFVKGKLAYMAPEQLKGLTYDHRIDIYSTGIMLCELVTGERLFQESDTIPVWVFMQNVATQDVDLPALFDKHNISDTIRSIIYKAIAIDPQDRYSSAGDMQSDIISALSLKSEAELRHKIAKFMKEIDIASIKHEEKRESIAVSLDSHVATIDLEGDISDGEKDTSLEAEELSGLSDIITPTKLHLPRYDKLRHEYRLERLQEMIDERNKFVLQSKRADPVSGLQKMERWVAHHKLSSFVKLSLDGKNIRLTIFWDKLKRSGKKGLEEVETGVSTDKITYEDEFHDEYGKKVFSSDATSMEGMDDQEIDEDEPVTKPFIVTEEEIPEGKGFTDDTIRSIKKTSKKSSKIPFIGVGLFLIIIVLIGLFLKFDISPLKLFRYDIPGTGKSITITSFPEGAEVIFGNETHGETPSTFSAPQKTFKVSLSLSGFPTISREVNLEQLEDSDDGIYFVFYKPVQIKTNSELAQIFINGERIGFSEAIKQWKVDNPLDIQARLQGFDPLEVTLTYREDGTLGVLPDKAPWLDVEAEPDAADLFLSFKFGKRVEFITDPSGAEFVDIDGKKHYATSGTQVWFPSGKRSVNFTKKGYESELYPFTIGPNFKNPPVIHLAKIEQPTVPSVASVQRLSDLRINIPVTVLSESDEPISGAKVIVKHKGNEESLSTDSNGSVLFNLSARPGDRLEVTFSAKGFVPLDDKRFNISEGETQYPLTLIAHSLVNPEILDRGQKLIKEGKLDDAVSMFNQIDQGSSPQEFAEYITAQYYIAYVYQSNREWDKAIDKYSQLLRLKVNHGPAYFNLAMCYFEREDFRRASDNFKNVLKYIDSVPPNQREPLSVKTRYYDALGFTQYVKQNLAKMSQEDKIRHVNEAMERWNQFWDFIPAEGDANIPELGRLKEEAKRYVESLKSL